MKTKLFAGVCVVLFSTTFAAAQQAEITRMTTIHNVIRNGQKGMLIQFDANVRGLRGREVCFAGFFYFADGQPLPAIAGALPKYVAPNGQLTVQRFEVPNFDNTRFTNVELFIPNFELAGVQPGQLNLKYQVEIQYDNGIRSNFVLAFSNYSYFDTLTK